MWSGLFALFIGQLLGAGLLQILLKFSLTEYPPIFLSVVRFTLAAIGISIFIYFSKNHTFSGKNTFSLVKRSVIFAVNICIFAIGIQYTTVIMAQVIGMSVPIFVAIAGYFVLGERMTKEKMIGFSLAFIGLSFLIYQSITTTQHLSFGTPIGNLLILTSSFCWSMYIVFSRKISSFHSGIRTSFVNFAFTAVGLAFLVPLELHTKTIHMSSFFDGPTISLFFFGILTVVQYVALQYGIKKTSASTVSFFQYIAPVIGAAFSVPTLHEKITFNLVFGALFIVFGVFCATTYPLLKKSKRAVQ